MKGKENALRSIKEWEKNEQIIASLIRCVANNQVKLLTTEAAIAKSGHKITQLASRFDVIEKNQQELLHKLTHLEHYLNH